MNTLAIKFVPIATIHFSQEELESLAIAAGKSLEASCRSLIQEGGLIFEMARTATRDGVDSSLYEDEVRRLLMATRQDQSMTTSWEIRTLHEQLLEVAKQLEAAFNQVN